LRRTWRLFSKMELLITIISSDKRTRPLNNKNDEFASLNENLYRSHFFWKLEKSIRKRKLCEAFPWNSVLWSTIHKSPYGAVFWCSRNSRIVKFWNSMLLWILAKFRCNVAQLLKMGRVFRKWRWILGDVASTLYAPADILPIRKIGNSLLRKRSDSRNSSWISQQMQEKKKLSETKRSAKNQILRCFDGKFRFSLYATLR